MVIKNWTCKKFKNTLPSKCTSAKWLSRKTWQSHLIVRLMTWLFVIITIISRQTNGGKLLKFLRRKMERLFMLVHLMNLRSLLWILAMSWKQLVKLIRILDWVLKCVRVQVVPRPLKLKKWWNKFWSKSICINRFRQWKSIELAKCQSDTRENLSNWLPWNKICQNLLK